jgi:hypothetical protein
VQGSVLKRLPSCPLAVLTFGEDVIMKLQGSLPLVRPAPQAIHSAVIAFADQSALSLLSSWQTYIYLKTHESDDRCFTSQMREATPKLGVTRLKLVRVVEAMVGGQA